MQLLSLSSGVYITPSPAAYIVVTMQVPLLRLGVNFSPNYTSPIAFKVIMMDILKHNKWHLKMLQITPLVSADGHDGVTEDAGDRRPGGAQH